MNLFSNIDKQDRYDAIFVGAGIMSTTLAMLLHELEPELRILIVEKLKEPGLEASNALNNAGTGHAGNCELNYTPQINNEIIIDKAFKINESFERSLEFWASLKSAGKLDTKLFLNFVPHISFVWGSEDVQFLKNRFVAMSSSSHYDDMEYADDFNELLEWIPLLMKGRSKKFPLAATRVKRGTDVDFGKLTNIYLSYLKNHGNLDVIYSTSVTSLKKKEDLWLVGMKNQSKKIILKTKFVFIGAGGESLKLLQKCRIPEGREYGGFPVSGKWLICDRKDIVNKHDSKVYGKSFKGSPPMSVPHLDTRWINGKKLLLFGPFAGFSTKFLKEGSFLDFFSSVNVNNLYPILNTGLNNVQLISYLIDQINMSNNDRINVLSKFFPAVDSKDWDLFQAGQRVQIIKKSRKGGILKMGTEIVCSSDGSLAALLGASPGASTAVSIMLDLLKTCWSEQMNSNQWMMKLKSLFPSYGSESFSNEISMDQIKARNDYLLERNT